MLVLETESLILMPEGYVNEVAKIFSFILDK